MKRHLSKGNHSQVAFLLIAVSVLAFFTLAVAIYPTSSATVQASFIAVGQGDSILLRDSNGFDVLIDGGKTSAGPTVLAYLRAQVVDDIEVMVATHTDADHIGGLIDVLEAADIPVVSVLYNGYPGDTLTWGNFATAAANEGATPAPAQYPTVYQWGGMTVYVLNPESGLTNPDQNNASVVLRVEHGNVTFLLTGDIDSTQEAAIVARGTPVAADILKVAHHGSQYSSGADFLAAVAPNEAVISVGTNSYGHPAPETLNRLLAAGARIWRTDQRGTIVITSNGLTYTLPVTFTLYLPVVANNTTPIPPLGSVQITNIDYAPPVTLDEVVTIQNVGANAVDMTNWTLCDLANNCFAFPSFNLVSGAYAYVWTKAGTDTTDNLYWGRAQAVWNNTGDTAYLRDNFGALINQYTYP